jgi:anaphase-promoting complex subunit 8
MNSLKTRQGNNIINLDD